MVRMMSKEEGLMNCNLLLFLIGAPGRGCDRYRTTPRCTTIMQICRKTKVAWMRPSIITGKPSSKCHHVINLSLRFSVFLCVSSFTSSPSFCSSDSIAHCGVDPAFKASPTAFCLVVPISHLRSGKLFRSAEIFMR